jgi:hypothetical protein
MNIDNFYIYSININSMLDKVEIISIKTSSSLTYVEVGL